MVMAPPPTKRSTRPSTKPADTPRKLRDIARHVRVPVGAVSSGWPAVYQKAGEIGLGADDWQVDLGKIALSKRASGQYAAGIGGVVWSIPRQVGKTYLLALIVFCLCLLHPGLTVLWTAHRLKTAGETFAKLKVFTTKRKIKPHIFKVTVGSGDEVIYFRNGSRILIGARERGFGRGFDDVDIEVFDEAQILTDAAVEDMVPAVNTAANPLLFFIGTPPRPKDPGEVFTAKRKAALAGDPDTAFCEFSADADGDENSEKQWRKANPSYPQRTPHTAMLRMKKNLPAPGSFRREALGIWDVTRSATVFDLKQWADLKTSAPPTQGTLAYGVKFTPDGARVALSVALRDGDGPVHVETIGVRLMSDGTGWLLDFLVPRWRKASVIVIDGRSGAGDLVNTLRAARVPARRLLVPTTEDVVTAHAGMLRAVQTAALTHIGQPGLDASVSVAGRRKIGQFGGWGFESITDDGDIVALESATLARHGVTTVKVQKTSSGKAVIG